jgi:antirestriction protein ArdC
MSKGSKRRPQNDKKLSKNWDRIFDDTTSCWDTEKEPVYDRLTDEIIEQLGGSGCPYNKPFPVEDK